MHPAGTKARPYAFKFDACKLARRHSERAELAAGGERAALRRQRLGRRQHRWRGLIGDIESNAGVRLAGLRVLLIGAGVPPPA